MYRMYIRELDKKCDPNNLKGMDSQKQQLREMSFLVNINNLGLALKQSKLLLLVGLACLPVTYIHRK